MRKVKSHLPPTLDAATLHKLLSAPLPESAIKQIPGTDRHSINDAYVRERLNEVFGVAGWTDKYKILSIEKSGTPESSWYAATAKCVLVAERYGIHHEQYGGTGNMDRGDAMKGACTDAFGKAASALGIGGEVYKGLLNNQNMPEVEQYSAPQGLGTLQHSRANKFVYLSGVVVEAILANGNGDCIWLNVAGIACCFPPLMLPTDHLTCKQISLHGLWETPKKGFKYLRVTNVLQVRAFDPIQIPSASRAERGEE